MRLLMLSSEFPPGPGGIGTHAYEVARHLTRTGWDVVVVTPQDYASEDEIEAFNARQPFVISRLRSLRFPPLKALYRWRESSRWMQEWRPHRLLATGDRAIWVAAALSRSSQVPWLAVGHGTEFGVTDFWARRLIRWSFEQATSTVCVSRYTWDQMIASGIRPRGGKVIPNGADAERFEVLSEEEIRDFKAQMGLAQANILLTVGNVTERKGQDIVVRTLPAILAKAPNTHYLIAGLPTRQKELVNLATRLGVARHVHLLGRVDDASLVRLLNCCDLFVMTSRHTSDGDFEGYGIAVVEAALCGKPSVVSADSGLAEAISEGETGFGVRENDEVDTAHRILGLLLDDGRRLKMGEAARLRALNEQSWEKRVRDYNALLSGLGTNQARGRAQNEPAGESAGL